MDGVSLTIIILLVIIILFLCAIVWHLYSHDSYIDVEDDRKFDHLQSKLKEIENKIDRLDK